MENNEIMKRLLQEDRHSESDKKSDGTVAKANRDGDLHISRIRVVTAKYKVYIVLLLIFISALGIKYIPNAMDSQKNKQDAYEQEISKLNGIEAKIKDAEDDMKFLTGIINNEKTLQSCLNEGDKEICGELPEEWKQGEGEEKEYNFSVPLSYLQLHSLYNKKMPIDEKAVLRNLNEYLIKQDFTLTGKSSKVGDILKIVIGDPESVTKGDEHFYVVPVDVSIEFTSVKQLVDFLYNVEKKLINNGKDRILYKIQAVSYDIIANDEPQITDISMLAYYYYDEKFENVDEFEYYNGTGDNLDISGDKSDESSEDKNVDEDDLLLSDLFENLK